MKTVASISGGKDSVAMCLELIRRGQTPDYIVFADTGMEYPECYNALDLFERQTGVKIVRLKSPHTFEWWMLDRPLKPRRDGKPRDFDTGYRLPSMLNRWCTSNLKRLPMQKFYREIGEPCLEYVGIAADEQNRVKDNPKKRYPLVEWGMTEADCLAYCRERGYYKSPCAYDDCSRMSCYFCPLQNLQQVRHLVMKRPELWREIKRLEKRLGVPWKRGTNYYERKFSQGELQI